MRKCVAAKSENQKSDLESLRVNSIPLFFTKVKSLNGDCKLILKIHQLFPDDKYPIPLSHQST